MPAIGGLIVALIGIFVVVAYAIPILTSWITAIILGKAGKLNDVDGFMIGVYFYGILGLMFAGAAVFSYDLTGWEAFWAFIGMFIGWPLAIDFMHFNQPDHGEKMAGWIVAISFIITQILAVIMVLKRASVETAGLDLDE